MLGLILAFSCHARNPHLEMQLSVSCRKQTAWCTLQGQSCFDSFLASPTEGTESWWESHVSETKAYSTLSTEKEKKPNNLGHDLYRNRCWGTCCKMSPPWRPSRCTEKTVAMVGVFFFFFLYCMHETPMQMFLYLHAKACYVWVVYSFFLPEISHTSIKHTSCPRIKWKFRIVKMPHIFCSPHQKSSRICLR